MKKILAYILLVLAASGCIYPFDAGIVPESGIRPVTVSGDILIGSVTEIGLGFVYPVGTPEGEMRRKTPSGSVTVINDRGGSYKGVKSGAGQYRIDTSAAPEDALYRLEIRLDDGREFRTPWTGVQEAPAIENLKFEVSDGTVRMLADLGGRDSLQFFRIDFEETWEYHADFVPDLMYLPGLPSADRENPQKIYRPRQADEDYYYCWNTASSAEPFTASSEELSENRLVSACFHSLPNTDTKFSVLYSVLVSARGMSERAYRYHYQVRSNSNATGDLFSPTPSELPGNIECVGKPSETVVGYVDAVCLAQARLYVPSNVYRETRNPESELYYPFPDEDGMYNFESLFARDAPVFCDDEIPTKTNVSWAPKRCTDCRLSGGSKNKPEWWPNDHR